jgi:hypothetical protein
MSKAPCSGPARSFASYCRPLHVTFLLALLFTSCSRHDSDVLKHAFCLDALRATGALVNVITGHATFGHPTRVPEVLSRLNQELERLGAAATNGQRAFVSDVSLAMDELTLAKSWTDPRDPHLISARIEVANLGESLRVLPHEICPGQEDA